MGAINNRVRGTARQQPMYGVILAQMHRDGVRGLAIQIGDDGRPASGQLFGQRLVPHRIGKIGAPGCLVAVQRVTVGLREVEQGEGVKVMTFVDFDYGAVPARREAQGAVEPCHHGVVLAEGQRTEPANDSFTIGRADDRNDSIRPVEEKTQDQEGESETMVRVEMRNEDDRQSREVHRFAIQTAHDVGRCFVQEESVDEERVIRQAVAQCATVSQDENVHGAPWDRGRVQHRPVSYCGPNRFLPDVHRARRQIKVKFSVEAGTSRGG